MLHLPWSKACLDAVPHLERMLEEYPDMKIGLVDGTGMYYVLLAISCIKSLPWNE